MVEGEVTMSDNRNSCSGIFQDARGNGTVCIDTSRVLDSCRDRDCFENTRVYLTCAGEEILAGASNIRARSAEILWAYVGVSEVPFNCGFYQISIRFYVGIDLEACLGVGRSQTFRGIAVLEKDVVLYGGEGNVTTFSSDPENSYCSPNAAARGTNNPTAIVETVEPIVLNTKIADCECKCNCCGCCDCNDMPTCVGNFIGSNLSNNENAPRLYVTFGVFSVIRIVRPAQLLVQATDYSVPDKECIAATNDENPCSVFDKMPFPISRFRGTNSAYNENGNGNGRNKGSCCGK